MNSVIIATIAVLPGVVLIVWLLASEHNLKKKNANQRFCLEEYGERIQKLGYKVIALQDTVRCLIAEIDYHLHGGVADTICDAARDWRDGDISGAYMSRSAMAKIVNGGTSLSGIRCRYCHMQLPPGELICSHCGAAMVDAESLRIWGGK